MTWSKSYTILSDIPREWNSCYLSISEAARLSTVPYNELKRANTRGDCRGPGSTGHPRCAYEGADTEVAMTTHLLPVNGSFIHHAGANWIRVTSHGAPANTNKRRHADEGFTHLYHGCSNGGRPQYASAETAYPATARISTGPEDLMLYTPYGWANTGVRRSSPVAPVVVMKEEQ